MTEQIVFMAPEGTRARLEAVAKEEDRKMGAYLRRVVLSHLDDIDSVAGDKPGSYGSDTWFRKGK